MLTRFIYNKKNILLFIPFLFFSCKKDKPIEPFSKRTIYYESFDNPSGWGVVPFGSDTCVNFEDGLLKLKFDQTFNNCGCAWVAAEYNNQSIYESTFLDKIGIRVKLNKGYFQEIGRYYDTIINGNHSQPGVMLTNSEFIFRFNSFYIELPNYFNGRVHRDSILNLNLNKLEGKEFEIIYNEGESIFKIDNVKYRSDLFYIDYQSYPNNNLRMKFQLGHLPELSPRKDTLYVDEIEIYTWTGVM